MKLLFSLLLIIPLLCFASIGTACTSDGNCIEKQQWQIGVALGLGVKTNPLNDGRDIPLVILPDIAWYGEKAYFDNGELGIQWLTKPTYSVETFISLDQERAFFSFLHPANILLPENSLVADAPKQDVFEDLEQTPSQLSIDDIASRNWALNGGIRGHYFFATSEFNVSIEQDLSNVHQGQKVELEYRYNTYWQDVRFHLGVSAAWKSTHLIDYYYGVSERDTNDSTLYFNGKSGWQPKISLGINKPINEKWQWLGAVSYRHLPRSLTSSPLIDKNSIKRIFVGVAYRY